MRLLLDDTNGILLVVEAGDTVDSLGHCVRQLSGRQGGAYFPPAEHVVDRGPDFVIHVQPHGDRTGFAVSIPKIESTNATLLALCAAYVAQHDSSD